MRTQSWTYGAVLAAGLAACSGGSTNPEQVRSEKQRITNPNVTQANVNTLAGDGNDFAGDLYRLLAESKENLLYSPTSITQALAMTYAGAKGTTEQGMADTLHFTLGQAGTHPAMNKLDLDLTSRGANQKGADGQPFRIKIANALWGEQTLSFLPSFLDTLGENYGAGLNVVDFIGASEPARLKINAWVEDATEGKIKDLLKPGTVNPDTRLVLTNAVYFNASWDKPFETWATKDATFKDIDGAAQTVPFMSSQSPRGFYQSSSYTAVSLDYAGNELSMVVVLPHPGKLAAVEQAFTGDEITKIALNLKPTEVDLSLPKFKYEAEISLAAELGKLGMGDAFSEAADFSGMTGTTGLAISDVLHKAFISVNEAGTEAAAATAVTIGVTSIPEFVTVDVDRPFLFYIRDHATGAVLFLGRVSKI